MDEKTYKRMFGETRKQMAARHSRVIPTNKPSRRVARSRTGDGWDVLDEYGKPVATGLDSEDDAKQWLEDNK